MLNKEYPQHDMNLVFDMIENSISKGGVHDKTAEEMNLLMHLYAGLPAEAVEQGMMFIHGRACEIPATSDIIPLHVRLMNLLEYLEKVEYLSEVPLLTLLSVMWRANPLSYNSNCSMYLKSFSASSSSLLARVL